MANTTVEIVAVGCGNLNIILVSPALLTFQREGTTSGHYCRDSVALRNVAKFISFTSQTIWTQKALRKIDTSKEISLLYLWYP